MLGILIIHVFKSHMQMTLYVCECFDDCVKLVFYMGPAHKMINFVLLSHRDGEAEKYKIFVSVFENVRVKVAVDNFAYAKTSLINVFILCLLCLRNTAWVFSHRIHLTGWRRYFSVVYWKVTVVNFQNLWLIPHELMLTWIRNCPKCSTNAKTINKRYGKI